MILRLYYKLQHQGRDILVQLLEDLQTARNGKLLWSLDIVEINQKIADATRQDRFLAQLNQQGNGGKTIISDIVLQLLSYVAQTERESIHQRQAEGIAAAKERGVHFGR